jgi:methyl-accepting chemotaxis protein
MKKNNTKDIPENSLKVKKTGGAIEHTPHRKRKIKYNFGHSIRVKLIAAFLLPVCFIIVLGTASYLTASNEIIDTFTKSTEDIIHSTGNYYDLIMENVEEKANQLSLNEDIKNYSSGYYDANSDEESKAYSRIYNTVYNQALTDKYIENITLLAANGKPISSAGAFSTADVYKTFSETEEGKSFENSGGKGWTGFHSFLDEHLKILTTKYAISYTTSFIDVYSRKAGYIQMDINMSSVIDTLEALELPNNSKVAFISSDGREITIAGDPKEQIFVNQSYYQNAILSEDLKGSSKTEYNGSEHLFIYSKVGTTGAVVAALIPYSQLTKRADFIRLLTVIIVIIASILAGVIGIVVASGISKTIRSILRTLLNVADGDLTVKVHTLRKDEFSDLSAGINHMIENMKNLLMKASSVGAMITSSTQNVAQNSELLLSASKDISSAISEIQQGIVQQATDTEQCLQQTDKLSSQIDLVYENSQAIEKITAKAKDVITNGIGVVDQLNDATKANIQITNQTIHDISELELESNAITEIIEVINNIASQTNLLSLNASIEAARAGDAGKGFSVVADEIRKLSLHSVNAAAEIEKLINNIRKKTRSTVNTVKQAELISKTTEAKLQNVVEVFYDINVHVDNLADNMNKIVVEVADIDKAKNDTLNAVESISAVAEETSAATEEVDATAQQQLDAVTILNEAAISMKNNVLELEQTIRLFKTE